MSTTNNDEKKIPGRPVPGQVYTREEMEAFSAASGLDRCVVGDTSATSQFPGMSPHFQQQDNKYYFTENLEILYGSIDGECAVMRPMPSCQMQALVGPPEDRTPCWHGSTEESFAENHELQQIVQKYIGIMEEKRHSLGPMSEETFAEVLSTIRRQHWTLFTQRNSPLEKHCFAWATKEMLALDENAQTLCRSKDVTALGLYLHYIQSPPENTDDAVLVAAINKFHHHFIKIRNSKRSMLRVLRKFNGCACFENVKFMGQTLIKVSCCDGCGNPKESPQIYACARCKMAYYCSKECQRADWKRGHRAECGLSSTA
ncbi:MAG: hypothetical protein SGILL_004432 [Bacillariaceae sp.]